LVVGWVGGGNRPVVTREEGATTAQKALVSKSVLLLRIGVAEDRGMRQNIAPLRPPWLP
jgi:hypothetical protein